MSATAKLDPDRADAQMAPPVDSSQLIVDQDKAYRTTTSSSGNQFFDNRLIFGDNLPALQSLEVEFAGKIKCVYIDPPYNTGSSFEYYNDDLEHTRWLAWMRERVEVLHRLLRPDGFFCCHIDDAESHYLKVLLDEVFGRAHYLTTLYVQVRFAEKTLKRDMAFHKQIEQVLVYRKGASATPNQNEKAVSFEKFKYTVRELGPGREVEIGGRKTILFQPGEYEIIEGVGNEFGLKEIWATGTILDGNSSGRFFRDHLAGRAAQDGLGVLYKVDGIGDDRFKYRYFTGPRRANASKGKYYQGVPLSLLEHPNEFANVPIENFYDMAASFGNCRHEGGVEFRSGKKPEALLSLILRHFSDSGDWVLDAFAGSGSTGAVAHKMGRRWIMIEKGDQCQTHIVPRLKRVIDGEDPTGVTQSSGWHGGGGYRYFRVAAPDEVLGSTGVIE
ncbi:site-specific DNA-methyltransferase [Planctomicrobium sp. SH661]|uniref:site-specific DNA-methyltransferase n=1 Tax=Planctomicrobium sp. SH661 TaxID=3448124 RepID=UPI003F5CAFF9